MDWTKGFTASYYIAEVDPESWRDIGFMDIIGGSVKHEATDLRDSASLTMKKYDGKERWLRIYLDASQNGASEHVPLFTGLATSPGRDYNGDYETSRVELYSTLKPCSDILLQRGWYAPTGISAGVIIENLLANTPAPHHINGVIPELSQSIIAEDDETALTMIDKILKAVNSGQGEDAVIWRMSIDGDGTIEIEEVSNDPVISFNRNDADAIEPEVSVESDWYSLPNVFRAVSDDLVAVARDERVDSPLSIENRGREIWSQEDNIDLNENESITDYAVRRLKELQEVAEKVSYKRRFNPEIKVGDRVFLNYPELKLSDNYIVSTQEINLGNGAETTEEVNNGYVDRE